MMKLRIKLRKLDYFRIILILLGIVLIIGSVDKITSFLNISIGWYDQNWKYRTAIITDYTKNSTNLTNHQVKIILNSHNFNYAHASVDGADIQFTENDGITPLDYWIEKWDNGGPSILWVKVPYIHASSKEIIYMYYGNPTARSVSSGENTFLFFDDFSSDKTTSPKDYFTDIGSSSSFISINQPAAQYYNGKTYIVFSGIGFDPYIAYHDHISGRWSDIVQVGDSPLMTDNHGPPALLIDNNGYLHVFYGAHTGALKHSKSTYPETISSWIVMPDVTSAATYPQVIQMSDGTIYLFYRAGEHADDWVYRTSLNNGLSWSKETAIIDGIKPRDAFYAMFIKGSNNTIHAAFIWKDDNNSLGAPRVEYYHRYNIYYIFKDTDGRWKNILGTNLTLPLTKTNADIYAKVYDSGRNHTQIPVIKVDSNNNPYILFLTGGYYGSTSYTYKFAKRTGDFWEIVDLGAITDNLFDFYNLDVISPTAIDAYLIRGGTKGVGDMNDRGGESRKMVKL